MFQREWDSLYMRKSMLSSLLQTHVNTLELLRGVHAGKSLGSKCCLSGMQLQEEHAAFAELLSAPQEEAKAIARRRFPVPRIVDCDQNGSQVRGWKG
jgi:hypothetical protein